MPAPKTVPLSAFVTRPPDELARRAADFAETMRRRRTVRDFASTPVPRDVIEQCLRAAGTAPSGANQQPWHFAVVRDRKSVV